jgi:tetratricopeptide (TPR) repeat protein
MPTVVFMERDARHDHRIARPDPADAATIGAPDPCTDCHKDRSQGWAAWWVDAWFQHDAAREAERGITAAFASARDEDSAAVPALLAVVTDGHDPIRRASACRLMEPWISRDDVVAALKQAARDEDGVIRASAMRALGAHVGDSRTRDILVAGTTDPLRSVRIEAGYGLRGTPVADLPETQRPTVHAAQDEWLDAQRAMAEWPEPNFNRGLFFEAQGDVGAAEEAYRAALSRWPASVPAEYQLALLIAKGGNRPEAETRLRRLQERAPAWPAAGCSLGLLLGEEQRWQEATDALSACVSADPTYPRAWYNLGLALAKQENWPGATSALEHAVTDPESRAEALRELVRIAVAQRDQATLDRWLPEALLADPNMREEPRVRAALGVE